MQGDGIRKSKSFDKMTLQIATQLMYCCVILIEQIKMINKMPILYLLSEILGTPTETTVLLKNVI